MNKPRSSIIFPQTLDLSVISIPPAVPETFNKRLHHHSSPFIVHINLWINLVEMISHSSSSRKGSSNTAFSIEQHTWSQWQHAEHWTDAPNRMALSSPLNRILQLDHLSDRGQIMWWLPPGQVKTLCYLRHRRAQERRPTNRRLCPQDRKFWDGTSTGSAHIDTDGSQPDHLPSDHQPDRVNNPRRASSWMGRDLQGVAVPCQGDDAVSQSDSTMYRSFFWK